MVRISQAGQGPLSQSINWTENRPAGQPSGEVDGGRMTERSDDRAVELGREFAMAAMSAHRDRIASLSPSDRLQWWFGFLTAGLGAARASLGEATFRSLRSVLAGGLDPSAEALRRQIAGIVKFARKRSTHAKKATTAET
jgi:hypothetical protein